LYLEKLRLPKVVEKNHPRIRVYKKNRVRRSIKAKLGEVKEDHKVI
jgi:hypothetical protein